MTEKIAFKAPSTNLKQINLPGSKSISNRLLILKFLSGSSKKIIGLSDAGDTQILEACLAQIHKRKQDELLVLNCEDGGTPLRFLMAICAMLDGVFRLEGTERLMNRPSADLISALQTMGAQIECLGENQNGPWIILGNLNLSSKRISISMATSSQFGSALILIAPFLKEGLEIELSEHRRSLPYINLSLEAIKAFGVKYEWKENLIKIKPGYQLPENIICEADWSSAIFFYAALALKRGGSLAFSNLNISSQQGDVFAENIFRYEGVKSSAKGDSLELSYSSPVWKLNSLSLNLSKYPDMAPALVVYYLIQGREVDFYGLESLSLKESIRDDVLGELVISCGAEWIKGDGIWSLRGKIKMKPEISRTHNDHRMVMAFSLLSVHFGDIHLDEIVSVKKSFPDYWQEIAKLGIGPLI